MKKTNMLLSTFFGCGYLSKIPGTLTSAVTTIFIYVVYEVLDYTDLKYSIIFFILLFFYSFYAVKDSESEFENKDPRQIVIDEVLGQAMPLILLLYLNQKDFLQKNDYNLFEYLQQYKDHHLLVQEKVAQNFFLCLLINDFHHQ